MNCPKCGGANLFAYVPGFWWPVDEVGDPVSDSDGSFSWVSESGLTEKYLCRSCDHEWEGGEG